MAKQAKQSAAQRLVLEYYKAKLSLMQVLNARWAAGAAFQLFTTPASKYPIRPIPLYKHAEPLSLQSGGLVIKGFHWRPKTPNGKRMLVIHGFAGSHRSFEKYTSAMLSEGYEVIAYDAPAHGGSEGKQLNVLLYRWMLGDVLKAHGFFDAYLAHSIGGMALMLALETAESLPEARIVLIAPLTSGESAANAFCHFLQLPAELEKGLKREMEHRSGYPLSWFSMQRLAPHFPPTVLWVHDEDDDTTVYTDIEPIVDQAPENIRFYITQGLGHTRIYRDTKVRQIVLRFLLAPH